MSEYIVIVGLMAIMLMTAVNAFRNSLDNTLQGSTRKIDSMIFDPMRDGPPGGG